MTDLVRIEHDPTPGNSQERLFCSIPFKWLEVNANGLSYPCCSAWVPYSIGSALSQPIKDLWNGPRAREIRRSILDGSFRYCTGSCPWLQTRSGPVQKVSDVTNPLYREIIAKNIEVMPQGPRIVNCAFDRSCNLACPSCRTERIVEKRRKAEILGMQVQLTNEAFGDLEALYITGSGDAFGSPYFRAWLRRMTADSLPRLKLIHLHTNAQLWTPRIWEKISPEVRRLIKSAEISIDAARPETYAINRKGGKWERLLRNLSFIAGLRREGPLEYLKIHMVVQANNYLEMPDFVDLGKRFNVDTVYFSRMTNWGTFNPEQFRERTVHDPAHPEHDSFLRVINSEPLYDPVVMTGNLSEFQDAARTRPRERYREIENVIE
jgi:hypothetical protein